MDDVSSHTKCEDPATPSNPGAPEELRHKIKCGAQVYDLGRGYEVKKLIGQGAFGSVVAGEREGRPVAIKKVPRPLPPPALGTPRRPTPHKACEPTLASNLAVTHASRRKEAQSLTHLRAQVCNAGGDKTAAKRLLREIRFLRHLRGHPNVISVEDVVVRWHKSTMDVYIVTELMEADLEQIIKSSQVDTQLYSRYRS